MAHSAFHFSLGMIVGTGALFPGVVRALRKGTKTAPAYARWLVGSASIGIYAIVPSLLRRMGVPPRVCDGWWMNLFLFHPAVQKMKAGGEIFAQGLIVFLFAAQYIALLFAIRTGVRREPVLPSEIKESE
ncbi:MAG: hypothetical protein HQ559_11310 [Lentisphaerae bacterium]|nr:hypothetical protein [Lentisphaerota bacterium]